MIRIAEQVSRAIRILRGNRDESARASHLVVNKDPLVTYEKALIGQAERKKFFQSTFFERKIMSTKTAFKRVALVAAAALAIGGITAVAANANAGQAAPSLGATTATAVPGAYTTVVLTAGTADKYYTIASSGVGSLLYPASAVNAAPDTSGLLASGSSEVWYSGGTPGGGSFNAAGNDVLTFSAFSAVAGTQTITITGTTSTAITETITWGAAPVVSAGNSLVIANNTAHTQVAAGAGISETTADTSITALAATGATANNTTASASVFVKLLDNASPTPGNVTTDAIAASVSGPGFVKIGSAALTTIAPLVTAANAGLLGRSVTAAAGQYALVYIYSDGTAGTSTITISDSTAGVVLGTATVVFYSTTIAKLVATTNHSVPLGVTAGALGGFTATSTAGFSTSRSTTTSGVLEPVTVVATDANGNPIPSNTTDTVQVSSSNTTVAGVASATASYDTLNSVWYPVITPVSEGSTVLTFTDSSSQRLR